MALVAAVWAVVRLRDPILKALGIAALVTTAVYLVTPLTAAGPPGQPHGFLTNTRYLMPALALALALLPLAGPLRSGPRRKVVTLLLLSVVFAVMVATTGKWEARFVAGSAFIAMTVIVAPAVAGWLRSARGLSRPLAVGLGALLLVPALALGRDQESRYARRHYTLRTLRAQEHGGPDRIFAWARNLHDQRIALAGGGGLFFDQGLFVGDDSSNWVQYIGESGPHGAYMVAPSCVAFRRLVNRGNYTFLVITEFGDNAPGRSRFPLHEWVRKDRALKLVMIEHAFPQTVYAYRILGSLGSRSCR